MSILKFENKEVRTILIDKEVWFVAKDVFEALDIVWKGNQSLNIIPVSWIMVTKLVTIQGERDTTAINFKAVSKIAFRSNKPQADEFTNKAAEIIDSVTKSGMHIEKEVSADELILALAKQNVNTRKRLELVEHKQEALESSLTIDPYERGQLKEIVDRIANVSPTLHWRVIWRTFNNRFGIASYSTLPKRQFAEAKRFLDVWYENESKTNTIPDPEEFFEEVA